MVSQRTAAPDNSRAAGKARTRGTKTALANAYDERSFEIAESGSHALPSHRTNATYVDHVESKFAHLLQPIRALADNWDVDLAKELEEYVGELEKLSFTFDGGVTKLNFAEAALLIQGSACVYSKKVEYLYEMVHQTLEAVMDRRKKQKSSVGENYVDTDISLLIDDEFLSCDDIQESSNIDLKDEGCSVEKKRTGAPLLPRIPPSLVPYTTNTRAGNDIGNLELLSSTGEVIGRRDDFKLNTALLHPSGALLLDNSERFLDKPCSLVATAVNVVDNFDRSRVVLPEDVHVMDEPPGGSDPVQADYVEYDDVGDSVSNHGMDLNYIEAANNDQPEEQPVANNGDPTQRPLRPRSDETDLWQMLDPHDLGPLPNRPFRKGRTYRMPKIKKPEEKEEAADLLPVNEFLKRMESMLRHRRPLPKDPLEAPAFEEFDYIFFAEEKLRETTEQEACASFVESPPGNDGGCDKFGMASPWDFPPVKACEGGAEYDVVHGSSGSPEGAFHDFEPGFDNPAEFESDDERGSAGGPEQSIGVAADLPEFVVEEVVPESYEDLCKLRIESYLLNAERFETEVESTLAKRVKSWEARLKPILEEHEMRPFLDVGVYGNRVIGTLTTNEQAEDGILPFPELVKNVEQYEVPRLFLATLHLANARNVDIVSSATDGLWVKLLDRNVRSLEA